MKKVNSTLYYIASVLFYVSAIINFVNDDTSTGVVWMALGSAFLCFGSVHSGKANERDEERKNNKEE